MIAERDFISRGSYFCAVFNLLLILALTLCVPLLLILALTLCVPLLLILALTLCVPLH